MNEKGLVEHLAHCKPLATKLTSQGYDYVFERGDLRFLPPLEQISASFFTTEDEVDGSSLLTRAGLDEFAFHWLIVFYEMREALQKHARLPSSPFHPFKERLELLVSEEADPLDTRLGLRDPEQFVLVALARFDPFYLSLAEKRLTINLTHRPGQPFPSLFTPRDQQTWKEYHRRLEREPEAIMALLPSDFFQRKRERR